MRLERSGREEVVQISSVGVAMYDDDALRPSRGLMHGVMISAGLYLLAAMVWLAI